MAQGQVNDPDFIAKFIDMDEERVDEAKKIIKEAINTCSDDREVAKMIKMHFDEMYGKIWHCVVGKGFGTYGTHETKNYLYIYYKQTAVQLWKCGYIYEKAAPTETKEEQN